MKLPILDAKRAKQGELELPKQFKEPFRPDLIRRAVHALQAAARQPYGSDPEAGKRSSAELSRRRRKYRGSYGAGISRVPRKILSRRGTRMYWVGAFAPGTVGGRRAHPPKAEKQWEQKINTRENRKAIRSALAATVDSARVAARGHKVPKEYPFLLDPSFEGLTRTSDVKKALLGLGFADELARAEKGRVRAGKGKMRGRKTVRATSLLLVCADGDAPLLKAARNVPGVDVVPVDALNAELLAPGTHAGRATLLTSAAIGRLAEGLFLDTGKKKQAGTIAVGDVSVDDASNSQAKQPKAKPRKSPKAAVAGGASAKTAKAAKAPVVGSAKATAPKKAKGEAA